MPYPVITIPPDVRERSEPMGTKPKFWFTHTDGKRWLFKFNRPNHGEDWSEKIATECADLLGLPHAVVDLASFEDKPGVMALDFTDRLRSGVLVHGNELLKVMVENYPTRSNFNVSQHTVERVLAILGLPMIQLPPGHAAPPGVTTAADLFVGYLLLDALVGNTDRHHENWAVMVKPADPPGVASHVISIAPTFDHASCLGRNLSDHERHERLQAKDKNRTVARFLSRAKSRLYRVEGDVKPLSPLEAFKEAARIRPDAGKAWTKILAGIETERFVAIFGHVPAERASPDALAFAAETLQLGRQALLDLP